MYIIMESYTAKKNIYWIKTRVCNDTDTGIGIGIGDTGISLLTPIPICGIADMSILKKDNYCAFVTAEAVLSLHI